jgi:pyridinium-3,5-biscarboxylic acid mononucleotide sulfurtransferase
VQFKNMTSASARKLIAYLERISPVAVALSGGLDSCVVAKAASEACKKSIAVTIDDYTVPRKDLRDAQETAGLCKITHVIVKSVPSKKVLENPVDRCFYCKQHNYGIVANTAKKFGIMTVVDGANEDDTKEYRPGMRAAREMNVVSPLLELKLGKKEIRKIANEFKLPVWDKPSSACLSSRIPHGERITEKKLGRVESAEEAIRQLTGIKKVRVRAHGKLARIEVEKEEMPKLLDRNLMDKVSKRLRVAGFSLVTLDLNGYRPGGS